jgi:UbiD family decarboxylase
VIVVDEDCNVRDWEEVMWRVVSTADPDRHLVMGKLHERTQHNRGEVDFDPPQRGAGIDATFRFKDASFPPVNKVSASLTDRVTRRWKEYGLP